MEENATRYGYQKITNLFTLNPLVCEVSMARHAPITHEYDLLY